jgi:DNA polymerase (family X)
MTVSRYNEEVAARFEEIADLLGLAGEDGFRVRAYRRAALTLRAARRQVADIVAQCRAAGSDPVKALDALPGVGRELGRKIVEIVDTGTCVALQKLRRRFAPELVELLRVPGLGPRRVQALHEELGVANRKDLQEAIRDGRVQGIRGFGARLAQRLALELEQGTPGERRWLRPAAEQYANELTAMLRKVAGVREVIVAGSYRRGRDTVGDLDVLISAGAADTVLAALRKYPLIESWLASGGRGATLRLTGGMHVDVRICRPASFGAALYYFTGGKAHNIRVRKLAQARGLKINEYGVFRGSRRIAGQTEASVAASVGLPWIAPELREDSGEIEAAIAGRLPQLLERAALRGDLHAHTNESDGHDDLEAMARAAQSAGLSYLAITDHASRLGLLRGLNERRLRAQMAAIDKSNSRSDGLVLLKGVEIDILEDGSLPLPDGLLAELDVVVAAVHSRFDLDAKRQTARVLRAMENRHVHILAHPTGRLLGERRPIALDMERVCRAAHARPFYLELDSQPQRLDLNDVHCRMAREHGVLVSIASDAHGAAQFDDLRHGVTQARRGWLGVADVLNTRSLPALRKLLRAAGA